MVNSIQRIVLVTPVWNDSARLEVFGLHLAKALAVANKPIFWIIADDGSDETERVRYEKLLQRFKAVYSDVELMRSIRRTRKGGAVYQAWGAYPEADYYAFVDADGAVDPESTLNLLDRALKRGEACAVVGVRRHKGAVAVRRRMLRALSCRLFRFFVHTIVGLKFSDTQCGAKVISGPSYRAVAPTLSERGYVFEVELLLALRIAGVTVEEVDLPWLEVANSKLNLLPDSLQMLAGLCRIRRRLKAGAYAECSLR